MTAQKQIGRTLKFESAEELQKQIDAYFVECDREEETRIYAHEPHQVEEYPEIVKGVLRCRSESSVPSAAENCFWMAASSSLAS